MSSCCCRRPLRCRESVSPHVAPPHNTPPRPAAVGTHPPPGTARSPQPSGRAAPRRPPLRPPARPAGRRGPLAAGRRGRDAGGGESRAAPGEEPPWDRVEPESWEPRLQEPGCLLSLRGVAVGRRRRRNEQFCISIRGHMAGKREDVFPGRSRAGRVAVGQRVSAAPRRPVPALGSGRNICFSCLCVGQVCCREAKPACEALLGTKTGCQN